MNKFQENKCVVVKNFIDPITIRTVSQYMENRLRSNEWSKRDQDFEYDSNPSQYLCYADPLIETILSASTTSLEEITGLSLYPTYSYSRIYVKGDQLTQHVDRPSCEISVTVNVATVGKPWPIYMKAPGKDLMKVELEPGDAVIYRGCEVTHWRETMADSEVNVQFMLHYVDQNGPHSRYKFDNRPNLGFSSSARRTS